VRLDALFTKFLGETASNFGSCLMLLSATGVFLFDEFDSIGLAVVHSTSSRNARVLKAFSSSLTTCVQ